MDKVTREKKEYDSLFGDERYAKKAWRNFITKSLQSDVTILPDFEDGKGGVTPQSVIYKAAVESVRKRLKAEHIDREPMKAEVLIEASIIRAAFDTSTLNVILDRTAGKVKDEISIGTSEYANMSDEELLLVAEYRKEKAKELQMIEQGATNNDNTE